MNLFSHTLSAPPTGGGGEKLCSLRCLILLVRPTKSDLRCEMCCVSDAALQIGLRLAALNQKSRDCKLEDNDHELWDSCSSVFIDPFLRFPVPSVCYITETQISLMPSAI
uniref:Uncharacterized protein n=1 Tax=Opuntia streptacantha TaxID=393608 RepID=A0A7C9ENH4_OPUST